MTTLWNKHSNTFPSAVPIARMTYARPENYRSSQKSLQPHRVYIFTYAPNAQASDINTTWQPTKHCNCHLIKSNMAAMMTPPNIHTTTSIQSISRTTTYHHRNTSNHYIAKNSDEESIKGPADQGRSARPESGHLGMSARSNDLPQGIGRDPTGKHCTCQELSHHIYTLITREDIS